MKRSTIIILSITGLLVFVGLVIFVLSLYIRSAELEGSVESSLPGYVSNGKAGIPSVNDEASYNNTQGSKVKKSGSVNFLVRDLDEGYKDLEKVNGEYTAEITNIFDSGKGNDRYIQVTIKVPVDKFEAYYDEVRSIEGEVTYANINTVDVTEEYIDITSRLTNLKNVEAQLTDILERANTVTDILAVQTELSKTRGEIERYEQQKRYFDSQADYAHLTVMFSIDKEGLSITDDEWKPLGEFRAAINSLVSVLKGFVNIAIWTLVFSPIVLIPAGIVWIAVRKKNAVEQKV